MDGKGAFSEASDIQRPPTQRQRVLRRSPGCSVRCNKGTYSLREWIALKRSFRNFQVLLKESTPKSCLCFCNGESPPERPESMIQKAALSCQNRLGPNSGRMIDPRRRRRKAGDGGPAHYAVQINLALSREIWRQSARASLIPWLNSERYSQRLSTRGQVVYKPATTGATGPIAKSSHA